MNFKIEMMKYFYYKQAQQRSTFPNNIKKGIQNPLRAPSCHCQTVFKREFFKDIYFLRNPTLLYLIINPATDAIKYSKKFSPNVASNNHQI